jgi:multidrug resistance efflux pump
MERQPVLGAPKATRGQPVAAADAPAKTRLPLGLKVLGVVVLLGVGVAGTLTVEGLTPNKGVPATGENALPVAQRAVAVAYVDVQGGVRSLSPTLPGRVRELPVVEGVEVPKGTVLLQLDDAQARNDLEQAKLALDVAQQKLVEARKLEGQRDRRIEMQKDAIVIAEEKEKAAKAQSDKVNELFKERLGGGTQDKLVAEAAVKGAAAAVRAERSKLEEYRSMNPAAAIRMAEDDVKSKQRQIEKAQLAVDECQIKAPCKGTILRQLVNVGELLGPTSPKPALQFCPSGDRIVRAEVEQDYARLVKVGQKAVVEDESDGSGRWAGHVIGVSQWYTQRRDIRLEPMQFNDVRTLEVIIKLDGEGTGPLRINQRVRVKLDGGE